MSANILPGDVREGCAITVPVTVHDEAHFTALPITAVTPAPRIQSEFERHVEPWQLHTRIEADGGNIMYAVAALLNNSRDFLQPVLR